MIYNWLSLSSLHCLKKLPDRSQCGVEDERLAGPSPLSSPSYLNIIEPDSANNFNPQPAGKTQPWQPSKLKILREQIR